MGRIADELCSDAGQDVKEIDYLVLHQANKYMIKQVTKILGLTPDKVPLTIDKYGNCSSATVPVTIASELKGQLQERQKIVLCGFGAGLSIGAAVLEIGPCECYGVVNYVET